MVAIARQSARLESRNFYVWMAGACVLVAFGGFAETFWLQLPARTFVGAPLIYLHGALFSAWTLFFFLQTALVAGGRIRDHRAWGIAGVSLATALVLVGMATAVHSLTTRLALGYGDQARAFVIVPISDIVLFTAFFAAAIANISRPERHKRWMLLATIGLLPAAVARVFFLLATGGGPGLRPGLPAPPPVQIALGPGLIVDLLVVAAIAYDWRTRGRPHPIYLVGLAVMLAVQLLHGPVSATPAWRGFADYLAGFAR